MSGWLRMEYDRIFKDGVHLFSGRIGVVLIGFLNLIILSRVLTTEDMGKYSIFLMIVNLALIVGLNWSDASIVRHGREEFVNSKKINQSFWARIYIFLPMILVFVLIFIIFGKQITDYIGIDRNLIFLVIIMFILNGLLNFINNIYQSIDKMKKSAYVLLSQKLFYVTLLLLAYFKIFGSNLTIILIIINVSFLLSLITNLFVFDFKIISPYKFNKEYLKKIWAYSWPQLIGFPGLYVVNYIDIFVIKKYLTLSDVGVYSVAYNAFMNICSFIMVIYIIFFPLIVEYKTKKRYFMIGKYLKKIPLFTLIWIILAIIGIAISQYIIPFLFSQKYLPSVPSFNLLLIASIFYFISVMLLPIVNAFDLIIYSQIFNLARALVNIFGDFILVPKIGIIGAAYATIFSYLTSLVLVIILIFVKRKSIFKKEND